MPPLRAAIEGARQIGFTVITISVSLVAAFIPLLFMSGVVGRLFREFSRHARVRDRGLDRGVAHGHADDLRAFRARAAEPDATWFDRVVERVLGVDGALAMRAASRWCCDYRALTLLVMAATIAITAMLYVRTPKGYFPQDDTGLIWGGTRASPEISFQAMFELQQKATDDRARRSGGGRRRLLDRHLGLERVGQPRHSCSSASSRCRSAAADRRAGGGAAADAAPPTSRPAGVLLSDAGRPGRRPLERFDLPVHAVGRRLRRAAALGAARCREDADACPGWSTSRPTASRAGCRSTSRSTGWRPRGSACACRTSPTRSTTPMAQRQISTLYTQRNQYRVILEIDPHYQRDPTDLARIYVSGANNTQVPLAAVTRIDRGLAPLVVNHQGQFPAITISFGLDPGTTIEEATRRIDRAVAELHLPDTLHAEYAGDARDYRQLDRRAAAADHGRADRRLHRARRALREPRASADDHLDAAVGRARRAAGAAAVQHRALADRLHRHHPADRHRQEERHHDGRLRARGRAQARARRRSGRSSRPAWSASGRS